MDGEREPVLRRHPGADNVLLKVLVPSIAAGAIIGKGGEAIAHVQKDKGAKVKMSKANDFYPGTAERVCLIQGSVGAITAVCHYIMEKVLEKPDPNPRLSGDGRLNVERHKQVKLLVPNSTAGMIIGKKGSFIKEIMDATGAYVQISQKPKDQSLSERCVTIAGDTEANHLALAMILDKIAEDPQSASCPNISYADVTGPVASAYPTGSPYAISSSPSGGMSPATPAGVGRVNSGGGGPLSLNSSQSSACSFGQFSVDALRLSLRQSGYSEAAADEIVGAMATLASYGFFNMQSLLQGQVPLISTPTTPLPMVPSPQSSFSMPPGSLSAAIGGGPAPSLPDGAGGALDVSGNGCGGAFIFPASFEAAFPPPQAFHLPNPAVAAAAAAAAQMEMDKQAMVAAAAGNVCKRDIDVPESLVGVILGPGGRDIVELQNNTQTSIQVSKRGDFQPQTRNRVVSITGSQVNVQKAERVILQRVNQEDHRRQHPSGNSRNS